MSGKLMFLLCCLLSSAFIIVTHIVNMYVAFLVTIILIIACSAFVTVMKTSEEFKYDTRDNKMALVNYLNDEIRYYKNVEISSSNILNDENSTDEEKEDARVRLEFADEHIKDIIEVAQAERIDNRLEF